VNKYLKKGDLITICMLGGYIPLKEQIEFFYEGFRYEPYMTKEEIAATIVKETYEGEALPQEKEDCLYLLSLTPEGSSLPNGVYERALGQYAQLFPKERKNGISFTRSFTDGEGAVNEEYSVNDIQSLSKSIGKNAK